MFNTVLAQCPMSWKAVGQTILQDVIKSATVHQVDINRKYLNVLIRLAQNYEINFKSSNELFSEINRLARADISHNAEL